MGTIKSNDIVVNTLASPISSKIGDIVTYIIQVTVPMGIVAENIRLQDTFPEATQEFITGSVLINGQPMNVEPVPSGGTITFPVVNRIDATSEEITEIYSFDVRIIDGTESANFIDRQVNNTQLTWNNSTSGNTDIVVNAQNSIDITMPFLEVRKFQNNITKNIADTTDEVSFSSIDTVIYKISVTNTGLNAAYNIAVEDTISSYLSVDSSTLSATKGEGKFTGNNLIWNIPILEIGQSAIIQFNVTGGNVVPVLGNIQNVANTNYSTNNNGFGKSLTPVVSNSIRLNINNLNLSIEASKNNALVGDTIQYIAIFSVYKGTTLDDAQLKSIIPNSQEYVANSATRQINSNTPEVVVPVISTIPEGQELTFPKPIIGPGNGIDASRENIIIKYIFSAKVISGMEVYPYTQNETIKASVNWSEGSTNEEINAIVDIILQSSSINVCKEQKNFTTSGDYTIGAISGTIGDTIYYKITVESNGAVGGYNLQLQDVLNNNLDFIDTIAEPSIGTVVKPTGTPGGILQWNIPALDAGTTAIYEFSVQINNNTPLGDDFNNSIVGQYSSDNVDTKIFNLSSNSLNVSVTGIAINASAPVSMGIGDKPQYTIKVIIPRGKTIYDLSLYIQLDLGQTYISSSWTSNSGNLGTPTLNMGNTNITYIEPRSTISAPAASDLEITYTFQTNTAYINELLPSSKNQITTINATWKNSSSGTIKGPVIAISNITVNRPKLIFLQEQRNITKGESVFTTNLIKNASIGNQLELSFTVTNNGTGNAYEVTIGDNLPDWLTFVSSSTPGVSIVGKRVGWEPGTVNVGQTVNAKITVSVNSLPSYPNPNHFYGNLQGSTVSSILLGPVESNRIGYNYVDPEFSVYLVDENGNKKFPSYVVGDVINYEFKIIVQKGTTAYNLYVARVTLPSGQTYVPNSLTSTGGVTISPSPSTLTFPNEGIVYSDTEDKIITYNFKVSVNSTISSAQERQEVETQLYWKKSSSDSISVTYGFLYEYLASIKLEFKKMQSLDGVNYVDSNIDIKRGEVVYYQLQINNSTSYTVYNLNITDSFPNNMIIQPVAIFNPVLIKNSSIVGNSRLELLIPILSSKVNITITYRAILEGTAVPGGAISSLATATYSTQSQYGSNIDVSTIFGPISSNELNTIISKESIEFNKKTDNKEAFWDEDVPYDITVKIPKGIQVYDLQVSDKYPKGLFFAGSAYINGQEVSVTIVSGIAYFPLINQNDATKETILKYTYKSGVIDEEEVAPFEKVLENIASISWGLSTGSSTRYTLNSSSTLVVKTPNISIEKLQRNKTNNGIFDTKQINVKTGDRLEFKLVVTNAGPGVGYNIVCTDILNDAIRYLNTISNSTGDVDYYSSTHTVEWHIYILPANTTATAIFQVEVIAGISAFGISENSINAKYHGKNNPTLSTSPIEQKYPLINLQITSDKTSFLVNDTITYNILVSVPNGTVFNNLKVQDILPVGQSFVSSTLNGASISPAINDQVIDFPITPNGTSGNFNYEIKAIVKSVDMSKGMADIQTDSANITWSLDSSDTQIVGPISDTVDVFTSTNLISVEKLQKVKSSGSFTTSNIEISTGEEAQYKIIITNAGKVKAYNVKIEDILNAKLQYISVDSSTQGSASLQNIGGQNVLVWEGITELNPSQSIELVYTVRGTSSTTAAVLNQAIPKFSIVPSGDELVGTPSNEVSTNILVGDAGLVQVEKLQRIKGIGNFTKNEMEITTEEQVEYKLVITNGAMKTYKIEVQDILNSKLEYIGATTPTVGIVQVQNISGKNVLVWSGITELNPNETLELIFTVKGVTSITDKISNEATSSFAITSTGANISGTPSNEVFTNILVGDPNLVQIEKLQRIKDIGSFTTSEIEISSGEKIEYKLVVTNGLRKSYKIEIQDILNNDFQFESITVSPTKGTAEIQNIGGKNVLVWSAIAELDPGESLELVFIVQGTSSTTERISNQATSNFAVTPTGNTIVGAPSNEAFVNILVGSADLVQVQKLQKIKDTGVFVDSDIEVSSGEQIQYKLIVTNGSVQTYKIQIQDILNNNLEFIGIDISPSKGTAALKTVGSDKVLIWDGITQLNPNEALELIFTVKTTSTVIERLSNQTTSSFAMTPTGNSMNGMISNEVFVNVLVGDPNFLTINKLQRIKGLGSFSLSDIDISSKEEIQYKLIIINNSAYSTYRVKVEDILNDKLQFISIDNVSVGAATVKSISGQNIVVWEGINKLDSKQAAELIFTVKGVSTTAETIFNQATSEFSMTPAGNILPGAPSNQVLVNILVGDSTLVKLQKFQRIKGTEKFSADNIEVSSEEEIEYKLTITNVGAMNVYNLNIQDILNNKLSFIDIGSVSKGVADLQQISGDNVIVWSSIGQLIPKETGELIYTVKAVPTIKDMIPNRATQSFAVTPTGASIAGLPSNEIWANILIGDSSFLNIQKLQRIKGIGDFLTDNLEISNEEEIEYKLIITNVSKVNLYKISIEDILNTKLQFVQVTFITSGDINLQQVDRKNVLVWNKIEKLGSGEKLELIFTLKGISIEGGTVSNQAKGNFAVTSTGATLETLPSNEVIVDILFSGEDLIKVEKFQRIKGIGQFCTSNIEINSGGEIEYKIKITNTGNISAYKINIQDIISDRLEFMGVVLASKGITEVKQVNNDEILVWNEIDKIIPNETEELIYLVKVILSDIENILNQASIDFALTPTGSELKGLPSNEVFTNILGVRYSFTPDNDSYISQNEAISYDVVGEKGAIGYILVNDYNISTSYRLKIGKIPFNYKLYINECFVEEIEGNTIYNEDSEILQNLKPNSINSISLEYIVPKYSNWGYEEINFDVMINLTKYNDSTTINSIIKLGKINLNTSYEIEENIKNKNMFLIKYNANVCISKGIKVYDLQLKAFYPPSYIFDLAYKDGVELESSDQNSQVMSKLFMDNKITEKGKESIIILEGELVFPIIKELDATNEPIQVNYSYVLLQYKNTPVSILGLDQNIVKLFFRSSKFQQEKNMIENIIFAQEHKEKLECVYVDKIFGKCAQYYSYKDIEIPILDTYMFSKIFFDNPRIINNSLIITPNSCGGDFSKVRYTFTIAYTIIYQGCGCLDLGSCSPCPIKEVRGTLVQKDLEVDLYMPMIQDNIYNIITESKVENIVISEDKDKFSVCISVITSSTTKGTVLVNNLGTCSITSCCRNK